MDKTTAQQIEIQPWVCLGSLVTGDFGTPGQVGEVVDLFGSDFVGEVALVRWLTPTGKYNFTGERVGTLVLHNVAADNA